MKRLFSRTPGRTLSDVTADSFDAVIRSGAAAFRPERHLPRVLPGGETELADRSPEGRQRTVARLARALRAERVRGRAGHWTYDLNRHIALAQAYEHELQRLADED
jgi:hypothetical protein